MKEIKVLHIVLSTVSGGMENVIYNLASGLRGTHVASSVGCLLEVGHLSDSLRELGIESHLVQRMIPGFSMVYPQSLVRFIRESGCDIVHTHSGCWFKVAMACAYLPHIKLIYTEHGRGVPEPSAQVFMDKLSIYTTDWVVTVSDDLREHMIHKIGLPARKVIVIHNGIDPSRFAPSADRDQTREELGYTPDNIVIGVVARLAPVKNHQYLIDVFEHVHARHPQTRLLLVGDGPNRTRLEALIRSKNLQAVITLAGDRVDVPRLIGAFDIATLSSRSEGISLTILETMAAGLPVVATSVGGNVKIITDGENGFLVDSNDIGRYIEKLCDLVASADLRRRIGEKARAHVIAHWSVEKMAQAYMKLYEELVRAS